MARLTLRHALSARARASKLPPGRLDRFDRGMDFDRHYVLKSARKYGPIFKAWWHGRYTTCVVGHSRARRLLAENEDLLVPRSIDLQPLFPVGWIRSMRGASHRDYRRLFIQALEAVSITAYEGEFRRIIRTNLEAISRLQPEDHQGIREALRSATSVIMLQVLFGVAPGSKMSGELLGLYRRFGPDHPPDRIHEQNGQAYIEIAHHIERLATSVGATEQSEAPSVLRHLIESGTIDRTVLGNLIYMFEPAYFDVYSLWHWILWHIAGHERVAERIAAALSRKSPDADDLIRAAILETLRLAQSEVLYREAHSDITFEGLFIPKESIVRVCLWEGHKDPTVFPKPFEYRPDRFMGCQFAINQFAPFGLDKHRCIGAELTLALSALFIKELVENFDCTLTGPQDPRLGAYHWEPNPSARISLLRRAQRHSH